MKLKISNSVYQKGNPGGYNGGGFGLTVKGGMLINERPDGMTGIAKMAEVKKATKRAEKINAQADAIVLGEEKIKMQNTTGPFMGW